MKPILLSAVIALSLAGCGNKGPLVLPSRPPADDAMPVEPPPVDAASPLGSASPTDAALDDTKGNTAGGDDSDIDAPPAPPAPPPR